MKKFTYLLAASFVLAGCAQTRQIGQVGDKKYHVVRSASFSGPNIAILVAEDEFGYSEVVASAAGSGIGHTVVGGASIVGGAAVFGGAIRPSRGNSINNASLSSSNSGSTSTSNGGTVNNSTTPPGPGFIPPGHIGNPSQNH